MPQAAPRTGQVAEPFTDPVIEPTEDHRAGHAPATCAPPIPELHDPELDALVREIIGRVADKWTMLAIETLAEHGRLRFHEIGNHIGGISQKMLTKTLRQMEFDGLLTRTVHPVIPPHVDYELTSLGYSLGYAFCGVWQWAEQNRESIEAARAAFRRRSQP